MNFKRLFLTIAAVSITLSIGFGMKYLFSEDFNFSIYLALMYTYSTYNNTKEQ